MALNIGSYTESNVPDTDITIDGLSSRGSAGIASGDTDRNKRISELSNAATLTGPEQIPIVQAGVTHKVSLAKLFGQGLGAFAVEGSTITGDEPLVTIQADTVVQMTLGQLYVLLNNWRILSAANPLDDTGSNDGPWNVDYTAGAPRSGSSSTGASVHFYGADGIDDGYGGSVFLHGGTGGPDSGIGGSIELSSGDATSGDPGDIILHTGNSDATRGKIILNTDIVSLPNTTQTTIWGDGIVYVQGDQDTWLFSSDVTGSDFSYSVGVGSGQADAGHSAYALLYTGNVNTGPSSGPVHLQSGDIASGTGRSGNIELLTGQSPGGTSGDITLTTNANATTRGNIILDTGGYPSTGLVIMNAIVVSQLGTPLELGSQDNTSLATSDAVDVFSGNSSGVHDSGEVSIGTGNQTGTGNSGIASVYTGDAAGGSSGLIGISTGPAGNGSSGNIGLATGNATGGVSGDIALQIGTATGTRGKIILDAPKVTLPFTGSGSSGGISLGNDGGNHGINELQYFTDNAGTGLYLYSGPEDWTAGTGNIGIAYLFTANTTGSGTSGWVGIGTGYTVDGDSGGGEVYTGVTAGSGNSGPILLHSGDAQGSARSGNVLALSGDSARGKSGDVKLTTGSAGGGNSGDISLTTGSIYTASAVHFTETANLTSASGFGTPSMFSYSFWFRMPSYDGSPHNQDFNFFLVDNHDASDSGAVGLTGSDDWTSPGLFFNYWPDPTDALFIDFGPPSASTDLYNGNWHHILCAIDGTSEQFVIYIDDQLITIPPWVNNSLWTPPLTFDWQGAMTLPQIRNAGQAFDMADVWIAPGVSLLNGGGTIDEATRRQFISSSGLPVNPSGFPSAAVLFSGDSTTFATNQGTGGSFSLTGSLTNADSSPSQPKRGNIILDAPNIMLPGMGGWANVQTPNTVSTDSDSVWFASGQVSTSGNTGICGMGSADNAGTGDTGWSQIGTGNAANGNSGYVVVASGAVSGAGHKSGDVILIVGNATDGAAFGSIVLNAPKVTAPVGQTIYIASETPTDTTASGSVGMESADTQVSGGNSGGAFVGTSDAGAQAGSLSLYAGASHGTDMSGGGVAITSGDAHTGNANGGDIYMATGNGVGTGTRGNIILDAPAVIQGLATFGPDPADQGVYGIVAEGFNIMATNAGGSNIGAWLYSADSAVHTAGAGVGTGNSNGGTSGDVWVYTGNITSGSGSSGIAYHWTGDVTDGTSGDVSIGTGAVHGTGTRGNIILDGPMIKRGSGQWYADSGVGFDIECLNTTSTGDASTAAVGVYMQSTFVDTLGQGGVLFLQAGNGGSSGGDGGLLGIQAGGSNHAGSTGGRLVIVGGQANVSNAIGGGITIQSGQGQGTGASGSIDFFSGVADNTSGTSGNVHIWTGDGANTGNIRITTQPATAGNSGDITIEVGTATGTRGNIIFGNLPSADPHVVGALWNSSGNLKISAG